MCIWSQFGQVFRLYGDLERDRSQSCSTQSYNGLSSSYLQKRSTTTDWPTGSSQAVHIPLHIPIKTIFYHSKGSQKGSWNEECYQAFMEIKQYLTESPILASPRAGDTLYLYLAVSEALVSATLFKEDENQKQRPIFIVRKSLSEVETRYARLKQVALALRVTPPTRHPVSSESVIFFINL